jgi:hypothetical protein
MALTAAAAAAAAEWSAQFLWIWFAEMRFVVSHHVSLVKLAEHVTLLKAAAATPRRAKFPSPAIRFGENYSPPSTGIWVTFIHTKPLVRLAHGPAAHIGSILVRFARGGTQVWLLQRPRGAVL